MGAANRTILIKGQLNTRHEEAPAHEILSPGHLVELLSTGKVQKNDTVTAAASILVAKEDSYQGKLITDAYAADDVVFYHVAKPGDVLNLRVPAAAAAIVIGDKLELVAAGVVQKLAAGVGKFIAEEALDNSAGGAEAFINARMI